MACHDVNRYSMVLNANVNGDGITQAAQGQQANNLALAQKTQTAIRKWQAVGTNTLSTKFNIGCEKQGIEIHNSHCHCK